MQRKRHNDQLAVTDFVRDEAAYDDPKAEAGEPRAIDQPRLEPRESKFRRPDAENSAANREADAGSENGHEACPEQAFGVGSNGYVADLRVMCGGCHWVCLDRVGVYNVKSGSLTISPPLSAD